MDLKYLKYLNIWALKAKGSVTWCTPLELNMHFNGDKHNV